MALTPEKVNELIQKADGLAAKEGSIFRALVKVTEAELQEQKSVSLSKTLADCRDIFPIPPEGHKLESVWLSAMGSTEAVPHYVRACVEDLHTQIEDKELELKKLAEAFQRQQVELARFKGCVNGRQS